MTSRPRLLISVRNAEEARVAIRGGAEIIDVKEPSAGSLGMASPAAIADVVQTVTASAAKIPCSVALGELLELPPLETLPIPSAVHWLKMGLSGCGPHPDWQTRWMSARQTIRAAASWIGVAYVDVNAALSPSIGDVLKAAVATGCAGLLLDTFSKTSGTLLDAVSIRELHDIVGETQAAGLLIALAGRVRRQDLPALLAPRPDIIAVRSAVCRNQDRTAIIDEDLVREFRAAMD